ncbi:MAG TPA: hypothetical protein PK208_15305 [Fibrobacteria bacterium]|nr:hypothetical protein [Fibrobacteria bacterium]
MKKLATLALLAASSSFAFDQYLPLAKGKAEAALTFVRVAPTGTNSVLK